MYTITHVNQNILLIEVKQSCRHSGLLSPTLDNHDQNIQAE